MLLLRTRGVNRGPTRSCDNETTRVVNPRLARRLTMFDRLLWPESREFVSQNEREITEGQSGSGLYIGIGWSRTRMCAEKWWIKQGAEVNSFSLFNNHKHLFIIQVTVEFT